MKLVAYVRDGGGDSAKFQRELISGWAEVEKHEIVGTYEDPVSPDVQVYKDEQGQIGELPRPDVESPYPAHYPQLGEAVRTVVGLPEIGGLVVDRAERLGDFTMQEFVVASLSTNLATVHIVGRFLPLSHPVDPTRDAARAAVRTLLEGFISFEQQIGLRDWHRPEDG